ncbi:hypothetical protein N9I01_00425 [bacterium]|nr:hypothetical protein [bacterium]
MQKRTSRGQIIDFEAMQAAQGSVPAVGNMQTDGNGNVLGPGGEVVETNEQRVRKYLRDNPSTSNDQVSLNTDNSTVTNTVGVDVVETKTAKTEAENVRTAQPKPIIEEPSEFDEPEEVEPMPEPLGYNEVETPEGDIDMVPYYNEEDKL